MIVISHNGALVLMEAILYPPVRFQGTSFVGVSGSVIELKVPLARHWQPNRLSTAFVER